MALRHEYMALTDHSLRLTVANGLSAERLEKQHDVVAALNEELAPFRILTGIECDINVGGSLDQTDELFDDRPDADCGRQTPTPTSSGTAPGGWSSAGGNSTAPSGRGRRASSTPRVFSACVEFGTAVEINSRPERLAPPKRLLRQAVEMR